MDLIYMDSRVFPLQSLKVHILRYVMVVNFQYCCQCCKCKDHNLVRFAFNEFILSNHFPNTTTKFTTNPIPSCHILTGWGLLHCPGQLLDNPFQKEIFPNLNLNLSNSNAI